ncbi:ABC transporter substrate-binding protein [Desulfosarcina alkanivorans]|uniref:ABC transporter substrate-binding protein n=1 Tax=Desulfosarcina alkanivorans TaxID=571177 RepID=A0A5K7YSC2_9BACT|nr:ABC transporter substrate-binding protein [Desulfosarcina alkanivorans]BBO72226.1 ABC transporter substrate-binding protein [Desulfosarcina alkanivorans]
MGNRQISFWVAAVWLFLAGAGLAGDLQVDPSVVDGGPYHRIISLYGAHTENLLALGAASRLAGIDGQSVHLPGAGGKAVFSYHDDPERFLAARPDLVLIRPMIARGYPRLVRRLRQSGIRVVSLQPTTVDQLAGYWSLLGQLADREPQADRMIRVFERSVAGFKRLSAQVQKRERVYFEAIHSKMKTFTPQAMAIFALETAGGINVAADAPVRENNNIAVYGKERLLSHAAEIDVFLSQQGAMNQTSVAAIMAEPGFGVIRAIKTGRVFQVDETMVSRPTLGLLNGIYHIGCLLYPDLYGSAGRDILASAGIDG